MKDKIKLLYEVFEEFPNVLVYILLLLKIIFQKTDVKLYKNPHSHGIEILGNGPSGVKTYLDTQKDTNQLMCVNYFALTDNFVILKPKLYVLLDPEFFVNLNEKNINLFNTFNDVNWMLELFIPSKYINVCKNVISNPYINLNAIRINYLPGKNKLVYFLYKKNLATPKFQNVIVSCIYIALNRNVSHVNLHGVEFNEFKSFRINIDNDILLKTSHFYGTNTINLSKNGTIQPKEFWKFLMHYVHMLKGISEVSNYSEYLKIKVINYTVESFIDSFDKNKRKKENHVQK